MHLTITVHTTDDLKMAIPEYIRHMDRAILNTVFENTVRRVNKCLETGGVALNITCNFLYCNNQEHRDFLIALYNADNHMLTYYIIILYNFIQPFFKC